MSGRRLPPLRSRPAHHRRARLAARTFAVLARDPADRRAGRGTLAGIRAAVLDLPGVLDVQVVEVTSGLGKQGRAPKVDMRVVCMGSLTELRRRVRDVVEDTRPAGVVVNISLEV